MPIGSSLPERPVRERSEPDRRRKYRSGWCGCADCTKFANSVSPPYTISERYWHWVNEVAKELAKTNPDKKVATIAYGASSPFAGP